jgi:cysteine-rich repeat protein
MPHASIACKVPSGPLYSWMRRHVVVGRLFLMRSHLRPGRRGAVLAMASVAALAPRSASADVITIDDGGLPGTAPIPFTCTTGPEDNLWRPAMGFVYRNVEPFDLIPGDTIAFDIQMRATDPDDIGFRPEVDIALAHASDPLTPFKPDDLPDSDFTLVVHDGTASGAGNRIVRDYDLVFTVDAPFHFPGGGLIIRVTNPRGVLATKSSDDCLSVITVDARPTGTNRLVGTFKQETGEYPWSIENTVNVPNVPYVRISWTRCGDSRVSGTEACDDGNTDNTDDCSNACLLAACGDGIVQVSEECDNSASPDHPDPYCDDTCHLAAFAKGSGCSTGGGVGAAVLVILCLALGRARRRRTAGLAALVIVSWAGSAHAQARTEGFRVDRFAMAPSVDDGLVVQDPGVLRHLAWSVDATIGLSSTVLRVVPRLSSDNGVDVVGSRLSAYLDFALGWGDRFEFNVALPFALAQSTESGTAAGIMLQRAGTTALGDARLGGSVLLYSRPDRPSFGLAATLALPVGSTRSFTGDGGIGAELLGTTGFAGRGYRVLVNAGVRFRPESDYVSTDQGSELIGRAGLLVPFADNRLMTSLELDVMARARGSDAFKTIGSPVLGLVGVRYHFDTGMYVGAGIGAGLTQAPGSPSVRTLVTIGYSPEPRPARRGLVAQPNDSDGDGIIDTLDKCPSQPEDKNGYQDEDGCPDAPPEPPDPDAPLTLEQVTTLPAPIEFKFDTAIMLPGAEVYLNKVLQLLQNHSEVLKLEIQGHTSSEGGPEYNLRLSNDRAKAVFTWLVDHGIDASRLVPRGYGLTQPIFVNDTEPHRQHNRRVQFRLLEQAPGSKPVDSQLKTAPITDPPPASGSPPSAAPPASPPATPTPPSPKP